MAIKPILFNTGMVQAILNGRKTCTRRLVKPQPDEKHTYLLGFVTDSTEKKNVGCFGFAANEYSGSIQYAKPPYGYAPGDILYVRETWERFECWNCEGDERGNCPKEPQKSVFDKTCGCYMYRATDEIRGDARWHSSIHMPKEAARIWLRIKSIRVERLHEITPQEAWKEGARCSCLHPVPDCAGNKTVFVNIWNSTVEKSDLDRYGWNANPYVWVIEFKRCKKPEEV